MAEEQTRVVDPKAPPPEEFKRIQPTLFIGIGGTGKEIMLRLRRRILQTLWNKNRVESMDEFPVASFLYFDTYTGAADDEKRMADMGQAADPLSALIKLQPSDCLQKRLDIDKYLKGEQLETYPHIKEWLPDGELSAIQKGKGAGQVRAISRLLFFDEVNILNGMIREKATALTQNLGDDRFKALGLEIEREGDRTALKIVVLCSIAGGTGSGAFIDMGYLCSSLQDPLKPSAVNLYAITGSAYAQQNERVLANSYAALAELEYCMSGVQDSYVSHWDEHKYIANSARTPYNKIYLVDNTNLTGQSTGDRGHLFGMIADALFEDLHDPELHGKRAEDSSNQDNFAINPFIPRGMPEDLGVHSQRFRRAYSAFGQVTLYTEGRAQFEKKTAELAQDMIEAFFRMTEKDKTNHPTSIEVEKFVATKLDLGVCYFREFPDFLLSAKGRSLDDFPIVNKLLTQGGARIDDKLSDHVRQGFAALRESGRDLSEWRGQAELIQQQRVQDIEGAVDSSQRDPTYPRILKEQRNLLMQAFEDSLREALYERLDNKERGGLTYTISLIQQICDAIRVEGTGICSRLETTAQALDEFVGDLRDGFYTRALANLEKAASKRLLRGPDREASLRCLSQAEEATRYYLLYRLRALACREAIGLLREQVIPELGQPSALGEETNSGATGILAEFERGRSAVRQALQELEAEIRILGDVVSSTSPLRASIPGGGIPTEVDIDRGRLAELGADALSQYGGSRELFQQLRDDQKRPMIISTLLDTACEFMQERESQLPTVLQALQAMPEPERRKLFWKAFNNAMPWVNGDPEKYDSEWDPAMITPFVAVENVGEFMGRFEDEIRSVLPKQLKKDICRVASGERGRLVIYMEYSGMPINVLIGMHDSWRDEYRKQMTRGNPLLHNHRRTERFRRPTAMSVEELRQLHDDLKLYLQGVGFGLLRRNEKREVYELNMIRDHVADWQSIGREQQLYLTGIPESKAILLRRQVEELERGMTARHKLLAAALFSYIAYRSYAPILVENRAGASSRRGGIAHHAAMALSEEYRKQYEATPEGRSAGGTIGRMLVALDQNIEHWSREVPGSLTDTTSHEANLDPDESDAERRAQPKRTVDMASISDVDIDRWASPSVLSEGSVAASAPASTTGRLHLSPPPIPDHDYFLVVNGQFQGPFNAGALPAKCHSRELTAETLVWRKELAILVKAGKLAELKHLFEQREPPPIPPA